MGCRTSLPGVDAGNRFVHKHFSINLVPPDDRWSVILHESLSKPSALVDVHCARALSPRTSYSGFMRSTGDNRNTQIHTQK